MCVDGDIFNFANGAEDVLRASIPKDASLCSPCSDLIPLSYHKPHYFWSCCYLFALPHLSVGFLKIDRLTIVLHILKCLENYRFDEEGGREKGQERKGSGVGPASAARRTAVLKFLY